MATGQTQQSATSTDIMQQNTEPCQKDDLFTVGTHIRDPSQVRTNQW